jgi:hypothetical protein
MKSFVFQAHAEAAPRLTRSLRVRSRVKVSAARARAGVLKS